ncbi:tumor necrosis factor alpha-induced protein 2-like [Salminus brasiliensis]|uniref:tumor necrosis factor alpha-induced protein 2-like n=1 Tax=Salminus brasiliensis TaxID=930266 RepID=UPI003B83399B
MDAQTVKSPSNPEMASSNNDLFTTSKHNGDTPPDTFPEDKKLSREVAESSCTVTTEQSVESLNDPESGSRKLQKQITHLFKNSKDSGHPDTLPEDKKLSREAGESSHSVTTEQIVESLSDPEDGSPKRRLKKQITSLLKNFKHSGGSDTPPEDKKLSREAGESSHSVTTDQIVESLSDPEAASPKRRLKKQVTRFLKNPKHSRGHDTPPEDKKLSREAGESSHSVTTEQIVESLSDPEHDSPKRRLKKQITRFLKNSKHSRGSDTPPEDKKLGKSREAGESSRSVTTEQIVESLSDPEAASPKRRLKKQITRFLKNSKHSGGHDTPPEDNKASRAVGGPSCTVMAEEMRGPPKKKNVKQIFQLLARASTPETLPEVAVVLNFNQNLEQNLLAEAGQQLLAREEQLFSSASADEQGVHTEEEEDQLKNDYDILITRVVMAVRNSFNKKNQMTLKSAVTAIIQEEERDRLWEEVAKNERPSWRPMKCREWHDTWLQKVLLQRIQQADEEGNELDSLKTEVNQMNRLIQNDLFQVVRDVQGCYPPEFQICHMYAQLYHQAFSTKLRQLPRSSIPIEDCIFILEQISSYSNNVLHHEELESDINSEALDPLLPDEDLNLLEEQYLLHKEGEVKTWLSNVLKFEEQSWQIGENPQLTDEYYCTLALDTINLVDSANKQATALLSNKSKAQRILFLLPDFLASYKNSIEELLKSQKDITEILKANLFSIYKLREYIKNRPDLSESTKTAWLSTAADIRDSCHKYFLGPIHDELKMNYSMLWTAAWFSEHCEIIEELENKLTEKISPLKDLDPACLQELLGQLHFEVMIKYVRKMLKRKLKLRHKEEQEAAAHLLCEDSSRINTLFIENGSDKMWLCEILPKVSEVLKVQDPDALELEICTLLKDYPDITERQVCAILQLKTNVSCADKRMIKECYHQSKNNLLDSEPPPPFFCKLPRSISLNLYSCFCIRPYFSVKKTLPCKNVCYSVNASSPV